MTIDTDREPTPSAEMDDAIGETTAEDQDSAAPAADQPGLLPSWLRIAVGIVVLAVLVVLAYPNLKERFASVTSPIESLTCPGESGTHARPVE